MTRLNFTERYDHMLQEMKANPAVTLDDEHRGERREYADDLDAAIAGVATRSGISLASKYRNYAFTEKSLGCRWKIPGGDYPLRGEMHLLDVFQALNGEHAEVFLDSEDEDEEEEELFDELRIIDRTPYGGGGELAAIRRKAGTPDPEMWFYGGSDKPFRLDIGYCEYLDALLVTKGTYGWQYLFRDLSSDNPDLGAGGWSVQMMLDIFPGLFPEHDYSDLQRRWEARQ
ncbi:hypothetical protein [Streptomyces sp. NPDC058989]|uniref:hypothetical protein n=1 Tax=Streptomyces sp. NPDC058989 TaxID=3346686 RepID=UPI00368FFC1D